MTRVALRGLLGRKLRTALTAVAILLGVAMVAGTFVLTDSIDQAFNSIFGQVREGASVVVSARSAFALNDQMGVEKPTLDKALLAKISSLPDVATADGGVSGTVLLIGKKGKALVYGGAPNLGFSINKPDSPFNPLTLTSGSWPRGDEVVIGESVAKREHISAGDTIGAQGEGAVEHFRVSGIVRFGHSASLGGATLAGFDLATAQRLLRKTGFDEISVAARSGVADTKLLREVRAALPSTALARTGQSQAREDAKDTSQFISFLRTFLLVFAGVALFVGSFVIANSLSITIAQRTREFATLRTLGASRRQVLASIFVEALVTSVVASFVGLGAGILLAKGLFRLFDAVGFTLPNSGLLVEPRTIVVALLVGILVTLVASLRPAIRATRVPPIAAVREGATLPESRFARFRTPGAGALTGLGFVALLYGLFGHLATKPILIYLGIGAVLVFFGVALLSVRFVPALAGVLGWPASRIGGAAGTLARDNARRNPQRTASTAAALMIGLALVTLVAVLAAGITHTFRSSVNALWGGADYAITAQNNFSPIPTSAAAAAAHVRGVEAVGNVRAGEARAYGKTIAVTAVDPQTRSIFTIDWKQGSQSLLSSLGAAGAFVDEAYAKKHHLAIGSPVTLTFANGTRGAFTVRGIFKPPTGGSPFGRVTLSAAAWDERTPNPRNLYSFVRTRGGETDANKQALASRLKAFPNAKVQTREQFIDNQISGLSSILNILYVLLALSVVVSLFGIVNTLVLTVFERTRELGMLRAVGMTRRQVRRMIRHESVITALIGGVLGIVLGIVFGALLVSRVDFIDFHLPVVSLVAFAVVTVIVGIVAAIFPARRASRLNVLEALQYE